MDSLKKYSVILIVFVILVLIFAFAKGGLLEWPAFDTKEIKVEKVAQILTAFIAVALVIERSGQVFIKMFQGREEAETKADLKKADLKLEAIAQKATIDLEIISQKAAFDLDFVARNMKAGQASEELVQKSQAAFLASENQKNDRILAQSERLAAVKSQGELEAKADKISMTVSLSLAVLIALSGFHFMESILGAEAISTIVDAPDRSITEATAAGNEEKSGAPFQIQLFRSVDLLLTSLLLAGGSTGLREILKVSREALSSKP